MPGTPWLARATGRKDDVRRHTSPMTGDAKGLVASRCRACGEAHFPPRSPCPGCWSTAIDELPLSSQATLVTFTIVRRAPEQFPVPYALGWASVVEGLRIFGRIETETPERLRVGEELRIVVPDDDDGPLSYWFAPLNGG